MIELELPGSGSPQHGDVALQHSLTYGRTRNMSRWHVPRSGLLHGRNSQRSFSVWCSATHLRPDADEAKRALMVDEIIDGVPVCGKCVGMATGAGHRLQVVQVLHEGGLIFEPRSVRIPRKCPGSEYVRWREVNLFVGQCLVCAEYMPIRHARGYDTGFSRLRIHEPGPGLVDPCPFHRWDQITSEGVCSCGAASIPVVAR